MLQWFATAANQQLLGHATAGLTLAAGPQEQEEGQQGQSSPVGGRTFVLTGTLPSLSRSAAQS